MPEYDIAELERLIDGELPWPRVQEIMKDAKDSDRFEKWVRSCRSACRGRSRSCCRSRRSLFIVQKGKRAHRQVQAAARSSATTA